MRTSLKGHPVRSTFLQIYLSTQIEIFLAALMFYESCGKAAAIEGSEHATDTCTYVHTPPTVVGELVSAMADECGQPDRSMMHSRLISRCNFLFPALLRISPCLRQLPANPHPAQPPCATGPVPHAGTRASDRATACKGRFSTILVSARGCPWAVLSSSQIGLCAARRLSPGVLRLACVLPVGCLQAFSYLALGGS